MRSTRRLSLVIAATSVVMVAIPLGVIQPFREQGHRALLLALALLRFGPAATVALAMVAVALAVRTFRRSKRRRDRALGVALALVAILCAAVARVNIFEKMFHPLGVPHFISAAEARVGPNDVVVTLRRHDVARAYPLRAIAYHHIVNDVVGGEPLAVTYCSLCHTGVVYSRVVAGRVLTLRIGGINNQNMMMRDEETGTFWQQSTGQALAGPLAGQRLQRLPSDELSFALWRGEAPDGAVLAPLAADESHYEPEDWEARTEKLPLVVNRDPSIPARALVIGVSLNGADRAYRREDVLARSPLRDELGGIPIVLVAAPDRVSIRAFAGADPGDAGGPGAPVATLVSYWFDWREHHPDTTVFGR